MTQHWQWTCWKTSSRLLTAWNSSQESNCLCLSASMPSTPECSPCHTGQTQHSACLSMRHLISHWHFTTHSIQTVCLSMRLLVSDWQFTTHSRHCYNHCDYTDALFDDRNRLNISKMAGDRGSVPKKHQQEIGYGELNGHVTNGGHVTWKGQGRDPNMLRAQYFDNGYRQRLGSKRLPIGNGLWEIEWSHVWWCHMTLKGQGRDPQYT